MAESILQVTEINHVVLHVSDLERSRRFYIDVLGFADNSPSMGGPRAMSFLGAGSQGLDLFEVRGQDVHGGQEMNHMALAVAGDDLDAVCSALAAGRCRCIGEDAPKYGDGLGPRWTPDRDPPQGGVALSAVADAFQPAPGQR